MIQDESLAGRHLGPFLIRSEIGRGGMGVVYHAHQPSLSRDVALKVLPRWFAAQPGFTERFVSEARAAARLHHANIVGIHDVGESGGLHYIVMQLLHGETLETLERRAGPLPPVRCLRIATQIASALDYAHRQGVVHRDVKPANIIVGEADHATLTDFGIARLAEQTVQRTMTGTVLGTPEYMAPEQAEGREITPAVDEYAFACVLFELLSGHPPFQADTPMSVILHQVRTPAPRLSVSRTGLSAALDGIFQRALDKDARARYPTCTAVVEAVSAALDGRRSVPYWTLNARRPPAVVPLIVAGVAAVVLVGVLLTAGLASRPPRAAPTAVGLSESATQPNLPPATPAAIASTSTASVVLPTALPTPGQVPAATGAPIGVPVVATPLPTSRPPTATPIPAPVVRATGPGGTLVLVRPNPQGGKDLFRMNLVDGGLARLTTSSAAWNFAPAASQDGRQLAFATGVPGASDIAVMRPDGSGRSIVARSGSLQYGSPWWMPDGRVAFNGSSGDTWEIYANYPGASEPPAPITSTPDIDGTRLPTWPANGGPLAIVGKQAGIFRVFVQTADGGFRPVSPAGAEGYAPAWSPDGRRLAFQSGGGALNGIVTMAPDGSDPRRIASPSGGAWARAPIWSPDGRWIAYVSSQSNTTGSDNGDVFVVPSDGGTPRQLTFDGSTYDWRLAWLP